jgi:hypothetical protein
MKKILLFLLVSALSYAGFSQSYTQADPAIGQPYMVDSVGNAVDPNALYIGQTVRIRLSVLNNDFFASIPAHDTRLQLSLGPQLQLTDPANIANAPLNAVFGWTVSTTTTGQEIRGEQNAVIPGNFSGIAEFTARVTGFTPPEGSVIVANFFVTNNNTNGDIIGDYQPTNNISNLRYRTVTALPVKFTDLLVSNVDCNVSVSWKVGEETGVSHYEVIVSNSGAGFRNVASANATAANGGAYNANFTIPADLKGQVLFVQVKAVDFDGKFTLSNIKTVRGNCDGNRPLVVYAYPNPVTTANFINVAAKEGVFNGKYRMELLDNNGKLYQVKEAQLDNVVSVPFEFRTTLSPGKYMIRITNLDGTQTSTVQFIKVGGVL